MCPDIHPSSRHTSDKQAAEKSIAQQMGVLADDPEWAVENGSKNLILEHLMAARRLGLRRCLRRYSFNQFRTGLRDGTLPVVTGLFSGRVLQLLDAKDDRFAVARIVFESSPFVSTESLRAADDEASNSKRHAWRSRFQSVRERAVTYIWSGA
ncbi:MAG: hypothetical protein R3D25_18210 [Geminicoccaceae bacterium]